MSYRDKEKYNEYLKNYMRERWHKRRADAIRQLGGKCVDCGNTNSLEFDHIDPETKVKAIAKMASASESKFQEELNKCQLLCVYCHNLKHHDERSEMMKINNPMWK